MPRLAIDHVQIAIPPGGEPEARRFFGDLLGLREIPKPPELAAHGGCWFDLGAQQFHVGIDGDFRAATKAHVAFVTDAFDATQDRLAAAGYPPRSGARVNGRRRFFADDPFGNRIELVDAEAAE